MAMIESTLVKMGHIQKFNDSLGDFLCSTSYHAQVRGSWAMASRLEIPQNLAPDTDNHNMRDQPALDRSDTISFNSAISGMCGHQWPLALQLFEEMDRWEEMGEEFE